MPETRVEGNLRNDIRRRIKSVTSGWRASDRRRNARSSGCDCYWIAGAGRNCVVVPATTGTSRTEQEIIAIAVSGKGSLRIFYRDGKPNFFHEIFRKTDSVLPGKREACRIRWIDCHRTRIVGLADIVARLNSRFVFRDQAPHLTAQEPPAIIESHLSPDLPEAEGIAIGLRSGRSVTGRKKVARDITGEFHFAGASVDVDRWTGLARRAEEL